MTQDLHETLAVSAHVQRLLPLIGIRLQLVCEEFVRAHLKSVAPRDISQGLHTETITQQICSSNSNTPQRVTLSLDSQDWLSRVFKTVAQQPTQQQHWHFT